MRALAGLLCVLAALFAQAALARAPQDLESIQREVRIAENIFDSALRTEWKNEIRVSAVNVAYLAEQGVLVSVDVNRPWLTLSEHGTQTFNIDSIPEIPRMVEDILNKLEIPIDPYHPEALEDLRALREEQRELRLESRKIRAKLRALRRELVRDEDEDERAEIREKIAEQEQELAAVDAQYEALRQDIDDQMAVIAEINKHPSRGTTSTVAEPDMASTVVKVACDYGSTLKSLDSDDHLSFIVTRADAKHYFVFKMADIQACSAGRMTSERLLELAYQY